MLSVVQVYISGHGGDGFMKFQDKEEVTSDEIGAAFALVSPCSQSATHLPGKGGRGGGGGGVASVLLPIIVVLDLPHVLHLLDGSAASQSFDMVLLTANILHVVNPLHKSLKPEST